MDYQPAIQIVEQRKSELRGVADADEYLRDLKKALTRQPEDYRQAATMAVDASKSLLSIAIAFFVAMGGFIQYGITRDLTWASVPIIFLGLAAISTVLSMMLGFNVIGRTYKRGEGRIDSSASAWSTEPIKGVLWWQSVTGLVALGCFAFAVGSWGTAEKKHGIGVAPVTAESLVPSAGARLRIEGEWTKLTIQRGEMRIDLGSVPSGQARAFDVELK